MLEVGAGSGYASAVASRLAAHVDAIERHPRLVEIARERLAAARLRQRRRATAATAASAGRRARRTTRSSSLPPARAFPPRCAEQLAVGGRLVMPVGDEHGAQRLVRVVREDADRFRETDLGGVMFVPLVGEQGWRADSSGA